MATTSSFLHRHTTSFQEYKLHASTPGLQGQPASEHERPPTYYDFTSTTTFHGLFIYLSEFTYCTLCSFHYPGFAQTNLRPFRKEYLYTHENTARSHFPNPHFAPSRFIMTFGSFAGICEKSGVPLCLVVGAVNATSPITTGIIAKCYARPVEIANTMIFQVGNAFIHFGALLVLLIIIFNVRSKYTAIGRSELLAYYYLNIALAISSLVVDCGVTPPASGSYPYFVALQLAMASAVCICLLYNGIVYFQFWEDGLRRSLLAMWTMTALWFVTNYIVAIATFKSWGSSLDYNTTTALFVVAYVLNAVILAVYVVSQLILVFFALDSVWYLGAIVLFCFFFVVGQVLLYVFSPQVCEGTGHYTDGKFFATVCNLFANMMVYKFWDMITTEDLEFSVANVEQGVTAFGDNEKRYSLYFN